MSFTVIPQGLTLRLGKLFFYSASYWFKNNTTVKLKISYTITKIKFILFKD